MNKRSGLVFNIITYYLLLAVCSIYNNRGGSIILNSTILYLETLLIDGIILFIEKRKKILNKCILIFQILIPFVLLLYKCQRYIYDEKIIYFNMPILSRVLIIGGILLMFIYAIYKAIKNWKKANNLELSKLVLVTTCLIIFAVNSVGISTNLIVPLDLHHSTEEVISYQQIFGKGQEAYVDYSPVSGLFPAFIGAVLETFGGNITSFQLAHSIFMIAFAMITMYILTKHLKKEDCLIVAMLFSFPGYDRIVFMLPSLLILLLPKLIARKNLWLKVWLWLCFVGGIYYPSFGGAVLAGTLPFAIIQLYMYIKSVEFKQSLKAIRFYMGWIICLFPIVLSSPMLINMAKHVLLYSSQTNLADGISVFGQSVPDYFMPYMSNLKLIRFAIYYSLRYMLPVASVWIIVLLFSKIIKKENIKEIIKSEKFLAFSSAIITVIVSYTATIVRNDPGLIVSRATYVIVLIAGILLFYIIKKYFEKDVMSYVVLGLSAGVVLILGYSPMTRLDSQFIYAYSINEDYEIISEELQEKYPRLGEGFITTEDAKMFENYANRAYKLLEYDSDLKFIAWGKLGVYYTLDLTTVGQPSLYAAKDYKTHKEIIDAIKSQKPVIGMDLSDTVLNYYLYNWLLTTNDYVYDESFEAFLPKELYEKIYGNEAVPSDKRDIKIYTTDLGRVSDSLGKSFDTLSKIMDKVNIEATEKGSNLVEENHIYEYKMDFDRTINENEVDYIYMEFDIDGNVYDENVSKWKRIFTKQIYNDGIYVVISWGDEDKDSILSILGEGKLLIPVGTNVNWLLNKHESMTINIKNVDKKLNIKKIEFYKLKTER